MSSSHEPLLRSYFLDDALWRSWSAELFPPLSRRDKAIRVIQLLGLLLGWSALGSISAWGLLYSGCTIQSAVTLGALLPPLSMMILNFSGLLQSRHNMNQSLATFRALIDGAAGQRRGLKAAHIRQIQLSTDTATLYIRVNIAWFAQPLDKQLTDLSHYCVAWHLFWNDYAGNLDWQLHITADTESASGILAQIQNTKIGMYLVYRSIEQAIEFN